MPNIKATQPKYFIEKLIFNEVLIRVKKFILFPINNVSSTQGFKKYYYAPTYFLVTTSIFVIH